MLKETSTRQGQLKANYEKVEASQEKSMAIITSSQEKMGASKDEMKAKMRATINPSQKEMKTAVYAIQSA
jgi:hypothetical protein